MGITQDPLLFQVAVPLSATFYPLGFPVEIVTNSQEVLDAGAESWGGECAEDAGRDGRCFAPVDGPEGCPRSEVPPRQSRLKDGAEAAARVHVVVHGTGAPGEPSFRGREHLLSIVAGTDNFVMADARSMFAYCFITKEAAEDRSWFRWYFLEAVVYFLLSQRYVAVVHAACVAKDGRGVLLSGRSGAGKSTLAFACARAGWTYLGDDATALAIGGDTRYAIGKAQQARFREDAPRIFPELAPYAARLRPNGKLSMEVPISELQGIRTARGCRVECVVFLNREKGARAFAEPIDGQTAVERFLEDMPAYSPEVNAMHCATVAQLAGAKAYEMRYEDLGGAIALLDRLIHS
jgi:hypothetical protein